MKILVVVDMQNDFITGALRNEDAIKIVPNVVDKVKKASVDPNTKVFFTMDAHDPLYYEESEEGKNLPIFHCVEGSTGYAIIPELSDYIVPKHIYKKGAFGSLHLMDFGIIEYADSHEIEYIEFVGVCTDICVVSNVLLAKAYFPNVHIKCDSSCCAGTTPEKHEAALEVMRSCHVEVI